MSIIDYSYSNLLILQNKIKEYKINYNNNLLFLPYQYNSIENFIIENNTNDYEYDVGIINAYISKDDSNSDSIVYKRNIIWEKKYNNKIGNMLILWVGEKKGIKLFIIVKLLLMFIILMYLIFSSILDAIE